MSIRHFIENLPFPISRAIEYPYRIIPPQIRFGKMFWETYNFLQESQWWRREKLEEYQMQQLEKLLNHSYENVPYYRRIFDENDIHPNDIQDFNDLKKFSYLTKDIVKDNLSELVARNYPKTKLIYSTTGGSTGIPLELYLEKGVTKNKEWAFIWRHWNWANFRFRNKRVVMRGNVINRFKNGVRHWKEYSAKDKALILSSFHMTDENLPKYFEEISKFKPVGVQGYPSSLSILAHYMKKENLKFEEIKCIFTSSESLYPHQRETIEECFGAKIWDHYGSEERCALVMQCEKGSYHIIPEYGIVELIGKDGNPIKKEGELGEIVATGFNNYATPFIRYKTGDMAVYSKQECSCGRNFPLLKKIEGRLQEVIITKDNRLIALTALIFAQHFEAFSNIRQMQLVQEEIGTVTVKIVRMPKYSDADEREILLKIQKAACDELDVKFAYVDYISRSKSGKYKFLIQKLPIEFGG